MQTKKSIVPVGDPVSGRYPSTTAWSVTFVPTATGPLVDGVVVVVVGALLTSTHSPVVASLEPVYAEPVGVYTARKHHVPAWFAATPRLEIACEVGGFVPWGAPKVTALPTAVPPMSHVFGSSVVLVESSS